MARAPSVAFAVLALPVALAGCPALLSDWSVAGGDGEPAQDATTGDSQGGGSPDATESGAEDALIDIALDSGTDRPETGDGGSVSGDEGDAASEAGTSTTCVTDLSGVGTGDFLIAFTLTTTNTTQTLAIVNQRAGCDQTSVWWDVNLDSAGGIGFGTCDGPGACAGVSAGNSVNDGLPHRIVIARAAGAISYSRDGVVGSAVVPDAYSFGAFGAALTIGNDACGSTPLTGNGTLTELCITKP